MLPVGLQRDTVHMTIGDGDAQFPDNRRIELRRIHNMSVLSTLSTLSTTLPLIGLDCRFAATQAGLGRYTRELVNALLERDDPWRYVLFSSGERDDGLHALLPHPRASRFPLPASHYSFKEHFLWPQAIRRSGIALLHSPHFNVPLWCPVPFVTTIHDLTLHHYPNQAGLARRLAYRLLMRHTLRRAAHVIAVSEHTKRDLLKYYMFLLSSSGHRRWPSRSATPNPLDFSSTRSESLEESTAHVSVVHEGVSPLFSQAATSDREMVSQQWRLPDRYFVYVGNCKEHKNIPTLVAAFEAVCAQHPDPDPTLLLVCHGQELRRIPLTSHVRILEQLEDKELRAIYTGAVAFVLPSLYEGFGLPCLEAMACGCPVIASNRTSIPEVCSDVALLAEPTVEGLSGAMLKLLRLNPESEDRRAIVERGILRAKQFTWDHTAAETAEVYAELLGTP